ncbi:MAG: DUF4159 domain-containing protein [Rhizobium sp.]|nr:DUF4159 domain-containing protein [Rhizobium sp.]
MMGGLAFATPLILTALIALPAIWWLLRLTPPRPEKEVFPPLRILLALGKREETPATTPWWLLLLRLTMAALVIIALAGPLLNPTAPSLSASGPVAIVFDNGWASTPSFDRRRATAATLIEEAGDKDLPVSIVFTADESHDATFGTAAEASNRLAAAVARPLPANRGAVMAAMDGAYSDIRPATLAFITDGLAAAEDKPFLDGLAALGASEVRVFGLDGADIVALSNAANTSDRMSVTATRIAAAAPGQFSVSARDLQGHVLANANLVFQPGETTATALIDAPFELRNDFSRLTIDGLETAGAVRLLDDSFKRRSVGLISGEIGDRSQPLLSPLYYINRALSPFANLSEAEGSDLATSIPAMTETAPSMIVMADIGRVPAAAERALDAWIRNGGTLVRFAGPRLATAPADDPLIPVRLREGERALGGSMSWASPQPLDAYPEASPFHGLAAPEGVLVNRQVLAEPSNELQDMTWASLRDGTPLVTARKLGNGRIVLFHVSAESSWSNLPLSGDFVEMLRRIVQLSSTAAQANTAGDGRTVLPPYRMLTAKGTLTTELGLAKPLEANATMKVSFANPPGLYGTEDGFAALNLLRADETLAPLVLPPAVPVVQAAFVGDDSLALKPWVFAAAVLLAIADTFAMLLLGGAFTRRASATAGLVLIALGLAFGPAIEARADDSKPGDETLLARLDKTHLAYVKTGEAEVDRISERGLAGLTDYLYYRTTLEPGDPVGVDIAKDELSVFPILYWPISANAAMPSQEAISRVDAYMRAGGTVLFDTRDQFSAISAASGVSPNTDRLRAILAAIDIPPLESVPTDHVLTKSFYLLNAYPGRYAGSPLWVEASSSKPDPSRPARAGDGVTPILITGNDFAGAWAVDDLGAPLLPLVPPDENQREMAYRTGVNIMMYMLTGNYKADQVHVPALLERLGQ